MSMYQLGYTLRTQMNTLGLSVQDTSGDGQSITNFGIGERSISLELR